MAANTFEPYRDVLLAGRHDEAEKQWLLAAAGFGDWRAADRWLQEIVREPETQPAAAALLPHLLAALAQTASPDRALLSFERFADSSAGDRGRLFEFLCASPRALDMLLTLFAGSQYLTEILLRNPTYFPRVVLPAELARPAPAHSAARFAAEARATVAPYLAGDGPAGQAAALDALRGFQKWEMLRIGMCDLCGLLDLSSVTAQLSHLADAVIQTALAVVSHESGLGSGGFVVLAMGKLGGGELNYSSDIDLLFLAESDATGYGRIGARLIDALSRATGEGFLYRVDMRLRPWGQVGPLVTTVKGHLAYLSQHARLWEKQALLKARPVAGDRAVGDRFLEAAWPLVYQLSPAQTRADIHAMKQRTEAYLRQNGRGWGEVKLGEGSIRDVEFVVQYLQLIHGGQHPEVRGGHTLQVLAHLAEDGLLTADEQRVLADGYVFLRTVEHYLQILDYRQTYTLPAAPGELAYLAHRLGFEGPEAAASFVTCYQQHSATVRTIYLSHLGGDAMKLPDEQSSQVVDVGRHLARLSAAYAATFDDDEIRLHAELAGRLSDEKPVLVDAVALETVLGEDVLAGGAHWRVTIVGYDYLGELSLICGLLFVYGFTIVDGNVYTYDVRTGLTNGTATPPVAGGRGSASGDARRKIVDVFTVRSVVGEPAEETWPRYEADLAALFQRLPAREQREAQGEMAKRVAAGLGERLGAHPTLYPIDIEIDNDTSERYTILRIDAPDTVGFLYEFTNALALNDIYIAQMQVSSAGNQVRDTLYVTDAGGRKISAPQKQRELRAATVLVKHFTHLLPLSPNPESALLHFDAYVGQLFRRPTWPDDLSSLERPEVLNALARLLGVSDFLWDDFLRMQYANLFPVVRDVDALATPKTREQMEAELAAALAAAPDRAARRDALNAFKDREMFRADMRYILGHSANLAQFQVELTALAETVVQAAFECCRRELSAQYGEPAPEGGRPSVMTVCALGKCGGRELGFASDIELMFVYTGGGPTTGGPASTSTPEYYEKLVVEIVRSIRARREGIFNIDLSLRPYGSAGSLAVSLDSFERYFAPGGAAWSYERQALIRLRPVAGDVALGEHIQALRDRFVYGGAPFDVAGMRAMRERQLRHLVTPGTINAKFSRGGLVDVEYLVQGLQIRYGHDPALRSPHTGEAIDALARGGVLSPADHARLHAAYVFLRRLIETLRVVRGNAKDLTVPPGESEEFAFLARRMDYGGDLARLRADVSGHTAAAQELSNRLLG